MAWSLPRGFLLGSPESPFKIQVSGGLPTVLQKARVGRAASILNPKGVPEQRGGPQRPQVSQEQRESGKYQIQRAMAHGNEQPTARSTEAWSPGRRRDPESLPKLQTRYLWIGDKRRQALGVHTPHSLEEKAAMIGSEAGRAGTWEGGASSRQPCATRPRESPAIFFKRTHLPRAPGVLTGLPAPLRPARGPPSLPHRKHCLLQISALWFSPRVRSPT